jgi:hypothetical protein
MEAVRTSETSVDNHFTRQYIPEDNSEHGPPCIDCNAHTTHFVYIYYVHFQLQISNNISCNCLLFWRRDSKRGSVASDRFPFYILLRCWISQQHLTSRRRTDNFLDILQTCTNQAQYRYLKINSIFFHKTSGIFIISWNYKFVTRRWCNDIK